MRRTGRKTIRKARNSWPSPSLRSFAATANTYLCQRPAMQVVSNPKFGVHSETWGHNTTPKRGGGQGGEGVREYRFLLFLFLFGRYSNSNNAMPLFTPMDITQMIFVTAADKNKIGDKNDLVIFSASLLLSTAQRWRCLVSSVHHHHNANRNNTMIKVCFD